MEGVRVKAFAGVIQEWWPTDSFDRGVNTLNYYENNNFLLRKCVLYYGANKHGFPIHHVVDPMCTCTFS